jgi:predicted nucleic acid-binding protein
VAAYFLDSSAAIKLYVTERGSPRVLGLTVPPQANEIFIVRITAVEIAAAFYRRVRGGTLSRPQAATASAALRADLATVYRVLEVDPSLVDEAIGVAARHGLRGYDCIQLAAALIAEQARQASGLRSLIVVSADRELNAAAQAEGFVVDDPNSHP